LHGEFAEREEHAGRVVQETFSSSIIEADYIHPCYLNGNPSSI